MRRILFIPLLFVFQLLQAQIISIDPAFGSDGFISYPVLSDYYPVAMEIYDDGRIILASENALSAVPSLSSVRFLPGGTVDNSWGFNGVQVFSSENDYDFVFINDLEVLSNNDLVFLLFTQYTDYNVDHGDLLLFSFDEDANLNFKINQDFANESEEVFYGLEELPGSSIRVSGNYSDYDSPEDYLTIMNFNTSGVGGFETQIYGQTAYHTANLPGSSFLIGGRFNGQGAVVKRIGFSQIDTNFGNNGYAYLSNAPIRKVFVQDDGKILAATSTNIFRLFPDGTLDTSYGTNGQISFNPNASGSSDYLSFFCDGRVMFANAAGDIYQYLPDGTLNPDFGTNGVYSVDYYGGSFSIRDFQLVGDTAFYVFGAINGNTEMIVGRYNLDVYDKDIGAIKVLSIESSGDLTNSETIGIRIKNFGTETQETYQLGYQLNDGTPVVEDVNIPISPGASLDYTFSTPGDFSTVGLYEVKVFSILADDAGLYNDTTLLMIEHLPDLDATVSNIANFTGCGSGLGFQFNLENSGSLSITSAEFEIFIDGISTDEIQWTGSLSPGSSTTINHIIEGDYPDTYDITVTIDLVNGISDEVPSNNSNTGMGIISLLEPGFPINIAFQTDGFPNETIWQIWDADGNVIASGGPYTLPYFVYYDYVCVPSPNACYTLYLEDEYGDGLFGFVEITNGEGDVFLFVDDFNGLGAFDAEYDFCISCLFGNIEVGGIGAEGPLAGSILITVDDPMGLIEYSIDGGQTFQSDSLFTDLSAGSYDIVVINDAGCIWITTIEIQECNLSATPILTSESGAGAGDGEIQMNASGFYPPMMFSIDGGQTFESSATFSNLEGGVYPLMIIDALSCVWTDTVEVYTCAINITDIQTTMETGPGSQNGTIYIYTTGAIGAVSYSINGGNTFQPSPFFQGLSGGVYEILVEDVGGCVYETTIEIVSCSLIADLEFSMESAPNANDAFILILAMDGVGDLSFSIDDGQTFSSGFLFDELGDGVYKVIVKDSLGCMWTKTIEILTCALNAAIETSIESTVGSADGSINVLALDGFGSLEYSIDNGQTFQSDPLFENLAGGPYEVLVQDSLGCSFSETIEILTCQLSGAIETSIESAVGATDGSINVLALDGFGSLEYSIDNGQTFQSDPLFENLAGGPYEVLVQDSLGCSFSETIEILTCQLSGAIETSVESAAGSEDGSINVLATDGFGPLEYSIDNGQTFQDDPLFENLSGGIYEIFVQDSLGCNWSITSEILTCALSFTSQVTDAANYSSEDGEIEIFASDGFGLLMYSIDGGQTFQSESLFQNLFPGIYTIIIIDEEGCFSEQEIELGFINTTSGLPFGLDFNCWPNPVSEVLYLEMTGLSNLTDEAVFRLLDISGRTMLVSRLSSKDDYKANLPTANLAAGTYIWTLEIDGYTAHGKIIKQ